MSERKLLIQGLDKSITKDQIEIHFQSRKKSGGGDIRCVELNSTKGEAVVEFEDDGVLSRVLQKEHTLKGCRISTALFQNSADDSLAKAECRTVRVSGLSCKTTEDALTNYFESSHRSAGGDVQEVKITGSTALVTFASTQVAKRVVQHLEHKLDGVPLKVALHILEDNVTAEDTGSCESRTIKVTGMASGTTEDALFNYFENTKRSGGGDVENVDMKPESNMAIVTFEEAQVAKRVVQHLEHKLDGVPLKVGLHDLEDNVTEEDTGSCESRTIKVTGMASVTTEDALFNYFENTKRSGGGEVESVDMKPESNMAIVTFKEGQVAKRVVQHLEHKLDGVPLKVALHDLEDVSDEDTGSCESRTIKVTGLASVTTEDALFNYFENTKRSGGGEVESVDMKPESNMAIVTFKEAQDARGAIAKGKHIIDKTELTVSLKRPVKKVPSDPCRLYVTGLSKKTTEDALLSFMEIASGLDVLNVDFGAQNNAVVTFNDTPDLSKVLAKCCKRQLDGSNLTAENIAVRNCLLVTGLNLRTSEDAISLHFENPKRGGGEVDKVEVHSEEGWALVFFNNPEDVEKAVQKAHTLDGKLLTVTPHQPLLEKKVSSTTDWVREKSIDVDPDVMSFICRTKDEELTALQKKWQLKMIWDNGSSLVTCVPTAETTEKSEWEECFQTFQTFLSKFSKETIVIVPETWKRFLEKSKELCESLKENVVLCNKTCRVLIIGENQDAKTVRDQLEDMKTDIDQELKAEASRVTEELTDVPKNKLLLLDRCGFKQDLQRSLEDLEIQISPEMQSMSFKGPRAALLKATTATWKRMAKIVETTVKLNLSSLDVLRTEAGQFYMMKKFEENAVKAIVVYEEDVEANEASVIAMNQEDAKRAVGLLEGAAAEKNVPLTEEQLQLTKSQKWCQFRDALLNGKLATISIDENSRNLLLVGVTEDVQPVGTKINAFFAENVIVNTILPMLEGSRRFLFRHMKDKVDAIQQKVQNQSVIIKESMEDGGGVLVSGTAEGVSLAKQKLQEVIASSIMKGKPVKIDKPGMTKFFTDGKGVKLLSLVENEHKCIVDRPSAAPSTPLQPKMPSVKECECSYTTPERKRISVFKDDITKHHVEVIVNAANSKLEHVGGLAKAIVNAGGKEIQEECDKILIEKGSLFEGHVAVTTGGNLPCKRIVHAVGPRWDEHVGSRKSRERGERLLHFAVMNALMEAMTFKSVAIPAISTGVFGFPRDLCAKIMLDAALEFSKENPHCALSEIHFTDTDDAAIREIVKEMTVRFKHDPSFCDSSKPKMKDVAKTKGGRKRGKAPPTSHGRGEQPNLDGGPNAVITPEGMRITLKAGDLSKQQADVIVNTASSSLELDKNACAKSLSAAAGPSLQQECSAKGQVNAGDMVVTGGGNLQCKQVFHVVCGPWNAGVGEEVLRKLIQKCLQEMQSRNLTTIAIPAIGTGNLSFPRDRVAIISLEEASVFSQKNPTSSIKDIRFVVYDKDQPTVQAFQAEFQRRQSQDASLSGKKRGRARGVTPVPTPLDVPSEEFDEVAEEVLEAAEKLDPNKPEILMGSVAVQVQAGDITKEATDAIVTLSNKDLDVAQGGGVGAAILRIGGQSIQTECSSLLKQAVPGGVVCTGAGKLTTRRIYHMIPSSFDESSLKGCIIECLRKADSDGVTSISFPAVGTGNYGIKPKNAAKMLLAAVEKFNDEQPQCLASVRIVVFQKHMIRDYHHVMKDGLTSKSRGGGFFSKMTSYIGGWFGYGHETGAPASHMTKAGNPSRDRIGFTIYAGNNKDITNAEKAIQELVTENYKHKAIESETVAKLSPNEKKRILQFQHQYGTSVEIEEAVGRIVIRGNPDDVLAVTIAVFEVLNKTAEEEHNRGFAELLSESVQWCFIDGDDAEPYDNDINAQIENAHKSGEKSVIFSEDDEKYEIVFKDNLETNLENGQKTRVVRKEIGKGIALPDNWVPQPTDSTGKEKEVHLVELNPETDKDEMQKIVSTVTTTAAVNILKIHRVQNPTVFKAYMVKKQRMDEKSGSNEKQLFHGTAGESCPKINSFGFNRSFCGKNATCYGNGVYFARDASYSTRTQYSPPDSYGNRFLFLSRVLVGEYALGRQGLITPPPKAGGASTDAYDTVVDNQSNPGIFVVFYDNQCYPDYQITFK